MTMLPTELQKLLDDVAACEREAEALVADMSDEEVNWQEQPGKTWSVAQCLDHLAVINPFYLRGFLPVVKRAREQAIGPFNGLHPTAGGRWFIRTMEPPVKRKVSTFKQIRPRSNLLQAGLVRALKASHDPYRAFVHACAAIDVNRVKGPNPILKIVPMRVSTVLQIIPAHDRRHLWQAQNVKKALRATTAYG